MSEYERSRSEESAPSNGNRLPCRHCGKSTPVVTMSQYGSRCLSCYEKYCAMTPAEIKAEYERGRLASRRLHSEGA